MPRKAAAEPKAKRVKEDGGVGKRAGRQPKDPNAPRAPPTAYMLWSQTMRTRVKDSEPTLSFADVSKRLGDMWSQMSDADKAPWNQKSVQLKEDYSHEKEKYEQSAEFAEFQATKKDAGGKKGKKVKDPNMPKRPLAAFMFFSQEKRPQLAQAGKSFAEVGKLLGEMWRDMTPAQKKPYDELARKDKERHQREKDAYDSGRGGAVAPKKKAAAKAAVAEEEDEEEADLGDDHDMEDEGEEDEGDEDDDE